MGLRLSSRKHDTHLPISGSQGQKAQSPLKAATSIWEEKGVGQAAPTCTFPLSFHIYLQALFIADTPLPPFQSGSSLFFLVSCLLITLVSRSTRLIHWGRLGSPYRPENASLPLYTLQIHPSPILLLLSSWDTFLQPLPTVYLFLSLSFSPPPFIRFLLLFPSSLSLSLSLYLCLSLSLLLSSLPSKPLLSIRLLLFYIYSFCPYKSSVFIFSSFSYYFC